MADKQQQGGEGQQQQEGIDIMRVPMQQLESVRQSLSQEVQTLTTAIKSLKHAQTKFSNSLESIKQVTPESAGKKSLVPLTESLYVYAELTDPSKILVDIGTGYYVEKSKEDAEAYFQRKVKFLTEQLQGVQVVASEKQREQAAVAEAYRIRMAQQQQQQQSGADSASSS
ncbi:hypothetical protein PTSG_04187 [Salpingoeca rosetta]|uniref:Prefoldin subunit 5 n=1 Tax=Salpingoeca rosetta (strain ATCC 50818 / BSB-021) TaxID=946362 RepID=F2U6U8_SALR5|nr:uncharacterized protein PTSG_04187 [Salpingoeca rosetta]EGD83580.1 hypothetical protein PTSG_04187 [Salpingoeca rosetta]|eukprot:XP_004995084.1 hypothetical protein PTSG_04187 [Salpingoeca rosetta]